MNYITHPMGNNSLLTAFKSSNIESFNLTNHNKIEIDLYENVSEAPTEMGYWTELFSEEQASMIARPGYYLAGYRCFARYCDNRQLYFRSYPNFDRNDGGSINQSWSNEISEESPNNCFIVSQGFLISGIQCRGGYCDNLRFYIAQNRTANLSVNKCRQFWTNWISEEGNPANDYIAPAGHFIIGYECRGRYCDDRRFLVTSLMDAQGESIESFNKINLQDIRSTTLSSGNINGSNNSYNQIPQGSILFYKTDQGRFGKLIIKEYGYDLKLQWETYNSNGDVFSSGDNLFIHGTYMCDLDQGQQTSSGSEFWWEQSSPINRYLVPRNGAKFGIYKTYSSNIPRDKCLDISSIRYFGNYPKNDENFWSEDIQGVSHDEENWFFTQKTTIWKFPVFLDLAKDLGSTSQPHFDDPNNKGVWYSDWYNKNGRSGRILKCHLPQILKDEGYNHLGSPDYYKGMLIVPVENTNSSHDNPLIAFFRGSDLEYLGHVELLKQTSAPWCAVNRDDDLLYTSNSAVNAQTPLYKYRIFWELAYQSSYPTNVGDTPYNLHKLNPVGTFILKNETGQILTLRSMQGGVFYQRDILFTINGSWTGQSDDVTKNRTGIMVFESKTGLRINKSKNMDNIGEFCYAYNPSSLVSEEPEGLTFWDLTDGQAPNIKGSLHAIMLDNDNPINADDLYFKHYEIKEIYNP